MAKLTCHPSCALDQLVIQYHPGADSFRHCDGHQVANSDGMSAKPEFSESTRICCVFKLDRQSHVLFQLCFQIKVVPFKVRRERQFLSLEVYTAGKTNAYAFTSSFRSRANEIS